MRRTKWKGASGKVISGSCLEIQEGVNMLSVIKLLSESKPGSLPYLVQV